MELSSTGSSTESKRNLFVLVEPSLLHHTFLLGPARFTALPLSALLHVLTLRVCSTTLVSFPCLRFNSTATGHFRGKK